MDGPALCQLRKDLNLTRRELAITFGVNPKTIKRWELGERPIDIDCVAMAQQLIHGRLRPVRLKNGRPRGSTAVLDSIKAALHHETIVARRLASFTTKLPKAQLDLLFAFANLLLKRHRHDSRRPTLHAHARPHPAPGPGAGPGLRGVQPDAPDDHGG